MIKTATTILFVFVFVFLVCKESVEKRSLEKKSQSQNETVLKKRMPHLSVFENIESNSNQICAYVYEYFELTGRPNVKIVNGQEYCEFNFHGMQVEIDTKHKGERYWVIHIKIWNPVLKIKKLYRLEIENEKLEQLNSTNHCYDFGVATDRYTDNSPGWKFAPCGAAKVIRFNNGKIDHAELYCYQTHNDGLPIPKQSKFNELAVSCGSLFVFKDDSISQKENNSVYDGKIKCDNECFEFSPYLAKGEYMIRKKNTILRSKPTRSSEVISTYQIDDKLEVLEDVGNLERISFQVAPWVRVRMFDGREGYIFGSLLKKEDEFWPPY